MAAPETARSARLRSRLTLLFAVLILVPSCLGFSNKFIEFVLVFRGDVDGAFAIAPIANYLLASLGFFLMFCWAAMNGMFRDIERPKYNMLENEQILDSQRDAF